MLGSSSSTRDDVRSAGGDNNISVKGKTIDKNGFVRPVAVASIFRPAVEIETKNPAVPEKRRFSTLIGDLTPSSETNSFLSSDEFARRRQSWDTRVVPQFGQNLLRKTSRKQTSPLRETLTPTDNDKTTKNAAVKPVVNGCVFPIETQSNSVINGETSIEKPERRVRVRPVNKELVENNTISTLNTEDSLLTNGTDDSVIIKGDVIRKRNALLQSTEVSNKSNTPPVQRKVSRGYHVTKLLDNLSESDINFFKAKKSDSSKSSVPSTPVTIKKELPVKTEVLVDSIQTTPDQNKKEPININGPRKRVVQESVNEIKEVSGIVVRARNRTPGLAKNESQTNNDLNIVNGHVPFLEKSQVSDNLPLTLSTKENKTGSVRRRGVVFDNIDVLSINTESSSKKEQQVTLNLSTSYKKPGQSNQIKSHDGSVNSNAIAPKSSKSQKIENSVAQVSLSSESYKVPKISPDQSHLVTKSSDLPQETAQPDYPSLKSGTSKKNEVINAHNSVSPISERASVNSSPSEFKNSTHDKVVDTSSASEQPKSKLIASPPIDKVEDPPKNARLTRRTSDLIAFKIQNIFSKVNTDNEVPKQKTKPVNESVKRSSLIQPNQAVCHNTAASTAVKTESMKLEDHEVVREKETIISPPKDDIKSSSEIEKIARCKETQSVKNTSDLPSETKVNKSQVLKDAVPIAPQSNVSTEVAPSKSMCSQRKTENAANFKSSNQLSSSMLTLSAVSDQSPSASQSSNKEQINKEIMQATVASTLVHQKIITSNIEKSKSSPKTVKKKLVQSCKSESCEASPKPTTGESPKQSLPAHNLNKPDFSVQNSSVPISSSVPPTLPEKIKNFTVATGNTIASIGTQLPPNISHPPVNTSPQSVISPIASTTNSATIVKQDISNGFDVSKNTNERDSFRIYPRDSSLKRHSSYISSPSSTSLGSSVESFNSLKDSDDITIVSNGYPRPPERRKISGPRDPSAISPIPPHPPITRTSSLKRFEDSKFLLDRSHAVYRSPSHSCVPSSLTPHRYSYTEMLSKMCSYGITPYGSSSLPSTYNQKYNSRGSLTQVSELWSDLTQEQTSSTHAAEILEAETTERMRLEKEVQELQSRYTHVQQKSDKMEMEMMEARVFRSSGVNGDLSEDEGEGNNSIYREKYERAVRDMEIMKRRIQQQHEEVVEQNLLNKKAADKKLAEALEDVEEERQVANQWKRKAQKLGSELQDLRLMLEEQMARNGELEKKQRRFDAELSTCQEEIKKERSAREKAVRDRDQAFQEKYSLEQELLSTRSDMDMQHEKITQLNREIDELTLSSKGEEEVTQLKRAKQELERKSRDQEEELEELAGQVQMLEQAKLRLEMSLEKLRQEHRRESSVREEEIEELRASFSKKIKNLEAQVETEQEERHQLVKQKHELERRVIELTDQPPPQDPEIERRLRRDLKRTKALLRDAQSMLEHVRDGQGNKSIIRQLKNQLEDAEFAKCAAVKAKQAAETELQDLQSQLEEVTRTKNEAESRCLQLSREKSAIQTQFEEAEEEMSEVMKKYKSAVAQMSIDQKTMAEQNQQITELEMERHTLKEQLSEVNSKFEHLAGQSEDSHKVHRLDARVRELESKLELEQTTRSRLDHQITRLKEQIERAQEECDNLRNKELQSQEGVRRYQRQIRDLREDYAALQQKEADAYRKQHELEMALEAVEGDLKVTKNDLRLACQRIEELKNALEDDLDSGTDVPDSGSDSDSSSYEMALLRQNLTPIQRCDSVSSDLSFGSRRSVTPLLGQDFSAMCSRGDAQTEINGFSQLDEDKPGSPNVNLEV